LWIKWWIDPVSFCDQRGIGFELCVRLAHAAAAVAERSGGGQAVMFVLRNARGEGRAARWPSALGFNVPFGWAALAIEILSGIRRLAGSPLILSNSVLTGLSSIKKVGRDSALA
jgi:hypothetical protein